MLADVLVKLYDRDLERLKTEIEQYSNEADLWKTNGEIANSAGNLTLHLVGNLKHFIGAILGKSGYVRDRDAEFSTGGVSKQSLLSDIEATATVVRSTLENMTDTDFAEIYPLEVFGEPMTTEFFVAHLTTHLNYHLGQINYHRRLLSAK